MTCHQVRKQLRNKYGGDFIEAAERGDHVNSRVKARLTISVSTCVSVCLRVSLCICACVLTGTSWVILQTPDEADILELLNAIALENGISISTGALDSVFDARQAKRLGACCCCTCPPP
jgi:hypothetical protein